MLYRTAVLAIVRPGRGLTVFVKGRRMLNTKVYDVMKRLAADISRDLSSAGHGNTIYHSVSRTKQRRQPGLHSGTYRNLRRQYLKPN
jgi:hypothetical protein